MANNIVTPTDEIVIRLDNRTKNPTATLHLSREMPWPLILSILLNICSELSARGMSMLPEQYRTLAKLEETKDAAHPYQYESPAAHDHLPFEPFTDNELNCRLCGSHIENHSKRQILQGE